MASIQLFAQDGAKKNELTVSDKVFGVTVKQALVHQAVRTQLANRRDPIANTKTRGEVRGGGKKPWKQKGTGRARHGSIRSPIWVGGGITFGPRAERNYTLAMPKKSKKLALCMALSAKAADGSLFGLEALALSAPKTAQLSAVLEKMPAKGDLLLVIDQKNENVERAAKNLKSVWVVRPEALNVVDLLKFRRVAVLKDAFPQIEKLFARA